MKKLDLHYDDGSIIRLASKPAPPAGEVYQLRKWGDAEMIPFGFDNSGYPSANFQALGMTNKVTGTGGVSNYLRIPNLEMRKVAALQVEDDYLDKKTGFDKTKNMEAWRAQKMNWLCGDRGTIYFSFHNFSDGTWYDLPFMEWGTICLGNNRVTVEGYEWMNVKTRDGVTSYRKVARLAGFTPADWSRPLSELLDLGLVHRAYCVYRDNRLGDSPKGIIYTPFWSPKHYLFIGKNKPQPEAFYIPVEWLKYRV